MSISSLHIRQFAVKARVNRQVNAHLRGPDAKRQRHGSNHLIVYDIGTGLEVYMDYEAKSLEAERIGLECVPLLYQGVVVSMDQLAGFLDRISYLPIATFFSPVKTA